MPFTPTELAALAADDAAIETADERAERQRRWVRESKQRMRERMGKAGWSAYLKAQKERAKLRRLKTPA